MKSDFMENKRKKLWEENKDKPSVKIAWNIDYDYQTDSIIPIIECPVCHELPCSTDQCDYCGTKFIQDDKKLQAYIKDNKGEKDEVGACMSCGGNNMHRISYKRNGEWRVGSGYCEDCGIQFIV